jgi:hypothetical protein
MFRCSCEHLQKIHVPSAQSVEKVNIKGPFFNYLMLITRWQCSPCVLSCVSWSCCWCPSVPSSWRPLSSP